MTQLAVCCAACDECCSQSLVLLLKLFLPSLCGTGDLPYPLVLGAGFFSFSFSLDEVFAQPLVLGAEFVTLDAQVNTLPCESFDFLLSSVNSRAEFVTFVLNSQGTLPEQSTVMHELGCIHHPVSSEMWMVNRVVATALALLGRLVVWRMPLASSIHL